MQLSIYTKSRGESRGEYYQKGETAKNENMLGICSQYLHLKLPEIVYTIKCQSNRSMIEYFILFCIFGILTYSNFIHMHPKRTTMIAYVGEEHPRLFERQYTSRDAELFVFRKKRYNSKRMIYKKKGTERNFFEKSDFKNMLIVHRLHYSVPSLHSGTVIYKHNNKTIAEYMSKISNQKIINIFI
jgi:hypothetical protein